MFKRICCLILMLCTLASVFMVTASAVTDDGNVMKDLSTLSIDGAPFQEGSYPADFSDTNMYVLTAVEMGYRSSSSSPTFAFYVYVYNPSCKIVVDDPSNSIQIGLNDSCEGYIYLGLKLLGQSSNKRFLKFKVVTTDTYGSVAQMYTSQRTDAERVYNIASLRLLVGGTLTTFPIKRAFCFSGYDSDESLTCGSKELSALDVEMYSTNWISPNAGYKTDGSTATVYDHYEINSVYFSLPRSLFEGEDKYDFIQSIRAAFQAYKTTPIIVTAPSYFDSNKGQVTKEAILNGTVIPRDGDIDIFDLVALYPSWFFGLTATFDWVYTENDNIYSEMEGTSTDVYDCLAYYFENSALEGFDFDTGEPSKLAVSAEKLEEYFMKRYNDPYFDNSKLYTESVPVIRDYYSTDFDKDALYNMSTYSSVVDVDKWYLKLTTKNDSYIYDDFDVTAEHLYVIKDPSKYASVSSASYETVANELFIGENDVAHFSGICANAVSNDEVVVLLRFGFSDYSCLPVHDLWETGGTYNHTTIAMAVEKWIYKDINLLHIVFSRNGQAILVPVVNDTTNSFGDIVIFEKPVASNPGEGIGGGSGGGEDGGLPEWLKTALQVILIVLAVVLIILFVYLVLPILKPLFGIAGDGLSSARDTAKRRRQKKNEELKKNDNEDKKGG